MKNFIAIITLFSFLLFGNYSLNAQSDTIADSNTVETVDDSQQMSTDYSADAEVTESASFHQVIKQKFIEGGPGFMGIVLLCLILGLALAIERIIYLNLATTDTDKLLNGVEHALQNGGVDAQKKCVEIQKGQLPLYFIKD